MPVFLNGVELTVYGGDPGWLMGLMPLSLLNNGAVFTLECGGSSYTWMSEKSQDFIEGFVLGVIAGLD